MYPLVLGTKEQMIPITQKYIVFRNETHIHIPKAQKAELCKHPERKRKTQAGTDLAVQSMSTHTGHDSRYRTLPPTVGSHAGWSHWSSPHPTSAEGPARMEWRGVTGTRLLSTRRGKHHVPLRPAPRWHWRSGPAAAFTSGRLPAVLRSSRSVGVHPNSKHRISPFHLRSRGAARTGACYE